MSALCFASSTIVNPLSTQNLTLKRDLRHANRKCSFRCNSQMHMSSPKGCLSRRAFVHLSLSLSLLPLPARAYNPFAEQQDLISHLEHAIPHPPISKIFQRDLYFPPSFQGTWDTYSTLLSVACPAGYKLFGRQGSFESAQKQVGETLVYPTRFATSNGRVICDRAYNLEAIASASMGTKSVLQIMKSAPDAQYMSISPQSAGGGIYTVSLNTLARSQQTSVLPAYAERAFHIDIPHDAAFESAKALMTCESVRQEVRLDTEDLRAMPQIKQIETVTIFVRNGDEITSLQRTSSYLTRSSLQYVDARGRPVDVRWYRVRYVPRERR